QKVVDDRGVDGDPETFARNRLVVAVPAGNPGALTGLRDLQRAELLIGLCAEEVPCGRFAREALAKAGVTPRIDTNEPDVRALLTRVAAGELDAGIVYVTDTIAAGDAVEPVEIPDEHNVVASYPIAVVLDAENGDGGTAFVAFVTGDVGQTILEKFGFVV
ncbi:MAG: substrate-binding domain-containing protein, partial [Chloroflexi bacterium]|nr:substrate-binding domain-containing protein [Chloroflexota bacterium]